MNCPQCGGGLPVGATICPECGAPVKQASPNHTPPGFEAELDVMLAQANLLRLRREYDRATMQCVEVLRRYPNSVSAHSLLGDIFRDQDALTDAQSWYKLALQLDPESAADRDKLAEVSARISAPRPPIAGPRSVRGQFSRLAHVRLPLGLVLGMTVGCLVLAGLLVLSMGHNGARATVLGSVGMPRVLSAPDPVSDPVASAPPSPRRTPRAAPSAPVAEPTVYVAGGEPPQLPPPRDVNYTSREQALLAALRDSAQAEELMVAVDTVAMDPRDEAATVGVTTRDLLGVPRNRGAVVHRCLRICELALACDDKLTRVTVRCKTPVVAASGLQQEQLVFIGDVSAEALKAAQGRRLNLEEALKLFAPAQWWHPCMTVSN